jgi:hypothetical protein
MHGGAPGSGAPKRGAGLIAGADTLMRTARRRLGDLSMKDTNEQTPKANP